MFIDPEIKRGFETRFGETVCGLEAVVYGMHALLAPNPSTHLSQFQWVLLLQGNAFWIGCGLCVFGVMAAVFAFSRFAVARITAHIFLFISWVTVMLTFLGFKTPGIPLLNGMVFGTASIAVIVVIFFHEKNRHHHLERA